MATTRTKTARSAAAISTVLGLFSVCSAAAEADAELLAAARAENLEAVRTLVAADVDLDAAEADGTTALAWAVHHDNIALASTLLQAGADVAEANRFGIAPIYLASENGSAAMLELLLAHGADPSSSAPEGETPLMTAARTGDTAAIEVLVEAGADVNAAEGRRGQTALMWAAAENNADAVRVLLEAGADRDARSAGGEFTALTFAVRAGAVEAARALLEAGADVDDTLLDGTSMLVLAATNAHYELGGLLLEHGADPNADEQGWTALHQIAWSRRWNRGFNLPGPAQTGDMSSLELVRRLVEAGADVNARQHEEPKDGNRNKLDRIGATPFLLAAKSCDVPLMRLLLDLGADASITTEEGTTALMAAAGVGIWAPGESPGTHEEALAAVQLALEAGGGDVNDVNANGETAVHGAVYRGGAIPVIEYLAGLGAKLDVVNDLGWTPLYAAEGVEYTPDVLKRYPEAAEVIRGLLRERGIDPETTL